MKINNIEIDNAKLLSRQEVLAHLLMNGEHDRSLMGIRDLYMERFGNELIWHYPISDSVHAGGAIVVVNDGFLWLPYDCVDEDDNETYKVDEAKVFDAMSMEFFISDWKSFSDDLLGAMKDMLSIIIGDSDENVSKSKLKPCPFCGGGAIMNQNVGHKLADGTPYSFITCNKCNISFALYHTHNADKIREAWNKRA